MEPSHLLRWLVAALHGTGRAAGSGAFPLISLLCRICSAVMLAVR
jgi:hypothetical protein